MAKETPRMQLGKGIRALITNIEERGTAPTGDEVLELARETMEIPVDAIEANPYQPRQDFEETALDELTNSIRVHGIIQPLTLRRLSEGQYQLIAGERRLKAARRAGLKTIPAFIRIADDQGMLEMAIVENIQRADLNAMEVAFSLQRLLEEVKLTHEELSLRVGKQRSTVTNFLRLLKLPPRIQQAVRKEEISMGHARAMLGLDDISSQLMVLGEIISKGLSVRETEREVAKYQDAPNKKNAGTQKKPKSSTLPAEVRKIESQLRSLLGTKVELNYKDGGKGEIKIPFSSDRELNEILDVLNDRDQ